jgi:ribosomal subunit interface protein
MQTMITGKKIQVGEALRSQAEDKIHVISQKYDLNPLECTVIFSKDGPMIKCEIEMHLGRGVKVRASEETNDAHLSLEQAIETFEKRLRRYKGKIVDHYKKKDVNYEKAPAFQYVIRSQTEQDAEADNPLIIAEVKTEIPTLTVSEAVMHLDLSDAQAMLFNNVAHDQINVVYRRQDGNIGWIAPSQNSQ